MEEEQELAVAEVSKQAIPVRKHIFFAEDEEEKTQLLEQVRQRRPEPVIDQPSEESSDLLEELEANPSEKALMKRRELVEARRRRVEQLEKLEHKLTLDRQMLGKGKRKKIGTDAYGFAKIKWEPERKK